MPQMSTLNWLILSMFFILIYYMLFMMVYFYMFMMFWSFKNMGISFKKFNYMFIW